MLPSIESHENQKFDSAALEEPKQPKNDAARDELLNKSMKAGTQTHFE
mgnify:CR=1 FL=1